MYFFGDIKLNMSAFVEMLINISQITMVNGILIHKNDLNIQGSLKRNNYYLIPFKNNLHSFIKVLE